MATLVYRPYFEFLGDALRILESDPGPAIPEKTELQRYLRRRIAELDNTFSVEYVRPLVKVSRKALFVLSAIEGAVGAAFLFTAPFALADRVVARTAGSGFPIGTVFALLFGLTMVADAVRIRRQLAQPAEGVSRRAHGQQVANS